MNNSERVSAQEEIGYLPQILTFFDIGQMSTVQRLTGGDANHSYLVSTQKGSEYVVKFPIEQTRESLENDVAVEKQLANAGIGSSMYLHKPDGTYIFEDGPMAVASPRIEGIHPNEIDEGIAFGIGKALAGFHQAVTELPIPRPAWLSPVITAQLTEKENDLFVQQARQYLEESKSIFDESLPRGIIHGDLHEGNLLVNPEDPTQVVALFDFEEAEDNLLIIDIARTMGGVCTKNEGRELDSDLLISFMAGYSSLRRLTDGELENLPKAFKWYAGAAILWYVKKGFPQNAQNTISRINSLELGE